MSDTHKYTTTVEERLAEVERELAMREKVYPEWIRQSKISRPNAAKRIALMKDIAADLRARLQEQEAAQGDLFSSAPQL